MSLSGRLMAWFPALHMALIAVCLWGFVAGPSLVGAVAIVGVIYGLPPLFWRIYRGFWGQKRRVWVLNRRGRCDWWIAHQTQGLFAALPGLEALLRLVPGLYSFWLRLWGSKIGRGVYWTARVEILDRHNLTVGDGVVFGHRVIVTGHVIVKKRGGLMVLVERSTEIGAGCFIGADARIAPGVKLKPGTIVPYRAEVRFRDA